jgi:hypothetical protein
VETPILDPNLANTSYHVPKARSGRGLLLTHIRRERYRCATQAAIWAREANPSFFKILPTWFSTVRLESESSEAMWRLVSPRPTRSATSCSRRVRGSGGTAILAERPPPSSPTRP